MKDHKQNGNALFFILIAVVMLGLLTIILTRSGSSVEQTGDFERNRIQLDQILRYSKSIETAIQQMKLNDISENEISFENTTTTTDYTNPNCDDASDRNYPGCLVFDIEGGGLTYRNFPTANDASDWIFTSDNNVGTTANPVGSTLTRSGNDIIMLLPNIDAALCTQINRDLSVGTAGTTPVDTTGISTNEFTGTFAGGTAVILDGDPAPFELDAQSAGCFLDQPSDTLYFYQVILAR